MVVVLCNEALRIVYANGAARDLFGDGRKLDGEDFNAILAAAPPAFREAIERETATIFSVEKPKRTQPCRRPAGRAGDVPPGPALLPAQHAAAHPVHPQAADARDPAQGGGHLEANHPGDQPRDQQLAGADLVADSFGPVNAAE